MTTTPISESLITDDFPEQLSKLQHEFQAITKSSQDIRAPEFQTHVRATLQLAQACQAATVSTHIFSNNEHYLDMTFEQLNAILIDYYTAILWQKQSVTRPLERLSILKHSDAVLDAFLQKCEDYALLKQEKRQKHLELIHRSSDEKNKVNSHRLSRDEKIEQYKLKQQLTEKLDYYIALQSSSSSKQNNEEHEKEEQAREQVMVVIQLAILEAMDEQISVVEEEKLLEHMIAMQDDPRKQNQREPPPAQGQGINVTHIGPTMEMTKETIRAQVFQPGHRLPTMSLEEYAEKEMEGALERQEKEKNTPIGPRRYDQLQEDGDEDDEALVKEATYKDRSWDDWCDANPKGSGNKKWSQF